MQPVGLFLLAKSSALVSSAAFVTLLAADKWGQATIAAPGVVGAVIFGLAARRRKRVEGLE